MHELDPRKKVILKAVIWEYVSDAEPVASDRIAQKYDLGVRSATVRSELAEMNELGYLEQPHTSAGRIPSDVGYRYYVDHMLDAHDPTGPDREKIVSTMEHSDVLRVILQDTIKLMSRLTHQMTAATILANSHLRVQSVVVAALGPLRALLVVAFSNGHVENRMIECAPETSLQDIGAATERLQSELVQKTLRQMLKLRLGGAEPKSPLDLLLSNATATLREVAQGLSTGKIVIEGEEYMVAQPELRRSEEAFADVMSQLSNEESFTQVVAVPEEGPLYITIGRENAQNEMRHLAVLRHRYHVHGEEAGTIAIVGPTRQDYDRNISVLSFAAKAISETLDKLTPGH